ncbi:hypothetical protein CMV_018910 [Castanea mollissima]|uniref:Uncharacterized protein n=1 Tax=Castanea mollissima TaxID=60419 RepID=A0A8J4VH93_9ROSI|nr:hypothetical protein CMV_018910 [Castanea mollissima]
MKSLEELLLYGTGISELPPSFGNLTGMIRLPQSARSAQTSEIFVQIREMIRLPPNLPPCHMLIVPHPNSSSTISPAFVPGYDSFPVYQPQSSLQKLFEDLNLGDRNLVQIFCETFADDGEIAPAITRVGVHVECICSPQKPRGSQISKSIVQRNRRRPALLHGSSFIMRKQYNTKRSTRIKENETLLIKFQQKHWKVGTPWRTIDDEQDSSIEDENDFVGDEICKKMTANDDLWETYIKVIGTYVGIATVGIFVLWYTQASFMDINLVSDRHTLVEFSQLHNLGKCLSWSNFTTNPFTVAGGHMISITDPCDYFTVGKVKAMTLSLSVLVSIEMFNSLNALSETAWSKCHLGGTLGFWLLSPVILIDEVLKFVGRSQRWIAKEKMA